MIYEIIIYIFTIRFAQYVQQQQNVIEDLHMN